MSPISKGPDVAHYAYRVVWSPEDQEFAATCAEFPSMSWLGPTQLEALQGLERLLARTVADLAKHGEEIPQPLVDRTYSGKFNLRVGEALHRRLALEAAEERLSLNQYVVRRLSASAP